MRRQLLLAVAALVLGVLLALALACAPLHAQTITARFDAAAATTKPDSVKQTVRWSVSRVTADSFVVFQGWTATGRNVDKNGAAESANGLSRYKVAGSTRAKTLYWRRHYGNTDTRWACVVAYRGGQIVPVNGGAVTPPPPTSYPRPSFQKAVYPGAPQDLPGAHWDSVMARTPVVTTVDSIFHSAPNSGMVAANGQTVRWEGAFSGPAGDYAFTVQPDDGVRVWIDDVSVLNSWFAQAGQTYRFTRTLTAGSHLLRVEYYNSNDAGYLRMWWTTPGGTVTPPPPTPATDCLGGKVSVSVWEPWKDGIFLAAADSAVARRGTAIIVGGWLPGRIPTAAEATCRAAATSSGLAQVVDLRSCLAQLDTAGAVLCVAVLDSAHSWGFTGQGNYDRCDKTFYRAIRGPRW